MPPILQKRTTKHFVNFTPKAEDFDENAFPKWREHVGNKYLALNPLTKAGQKEVAKFNNLCLHDDFWDRPLHDTYWDLLVEVHKKGPLDGWNAGTREGLHRRTGIFIRLLCAKFDSEVFRANTLTENDFIQMGIGKKTNRSDEDFRKAVRNKTFYGKETAQSLLLTNCTFIHFTKPNLDASEAAWHHRSISQNIAENKVQSANRCPWQIQGEIMGYWIRTMTQHSATLRPDFSQIIYPTYVPMAPEKVSKLLGEESNLESAFPTMTLLMSDEYKAYVDDPTNDQIASTARDLFKAQPLRNNLGELMFNVPNDSQLASYYLEDGSNVPTHLEFPFFPSWEALATDSGKSFQEDSTMTAFTANAAILAPILVYNLFKGGDSKGNILSSEEAIASDTRKNLTWYYLHFMNNQNTKTWMQIHGAYSAHYSFEQADTICDESSCFLGCIHFTILYFNAALVCHREGRLETDWDSRQKRFILVGNTVEKTYGTFGCTDAGRDTKSVRFIVGKNPNSHYPG